MNWKARLHQWQVSENVPSYLKTQIESLNDDELFDSFYRYLEFGTGGMRGGIGPGTNRINIVMIRRVTVALAMYVIENKGEDAGVVISYDNRYYSKEFAHETGRVLASFGIKVYLSDFIRPTPIVSFSIRKYKAFAGVMITASHNPAQYNGYKIYNTSGGQITLDTANKISSYLAKIHDETDIHISDSSISSNLIHTFGEDIDRSYLLALKEVTVNRELIANNNGIVQIVYTPLHGSGLNLVSKGLQEVGFKQLFIVKEQADYDSGFSTVQTPNPEERGVFDKAIEIGNAVEADLLIGTDPDTDRLGVAIRDNHDNNAYRLLSGNEIGSLMLYYLANNKHVPNSYVLKTIVTTDLTYKIANDFDLNVIDTLTGFKFIGEKINELEQKNKSFLFGFEESFGYLVKPFVRDKDAIQAAILMAEIVLFYKLNNQSVIDVLYEIGEKYGFYKESLRTMSYKGSEAIQQLADEMNYLRHNYPKKIGELGVSRIQDYLLGTEYEVASGKVMSLKLPKSNVIKIFLEDDSWVCIRPSGTEPKSKIYFSANDPHESNAIQKLNNIEMKFLSYFNGINEKVKSMN
ncbi:phospho-sugar mutase [Fundicoccus culcitae]|uniref:Phospho-sugar mutase n=1 Tax=Fundicoccus culcitae TaxID=2969821 RepID=A0ABY5P8P7_9LACT|nr:phospho-sugar mutase [Fundicoccus culcitae]UUX35122.1 phospho-sugar mutase [Fundicoccus culcitae]